MRKIKQYFISHNICFHICALILWVWGLSLIFVLFMGLMISFRDGLDYSLYPRKFFPDKFVFSNYAEAIRTLSFGTTTYGKMIWNSVWFTFGTTFMKVMATTLCAYTVAKYNFPGRKVFYGFIIVQLMLPIYGQSTANYKLLSSIGLVDNGWFLLAQGAGHGMYFLIMYSYFENLSSMYMEAARLDGANDFTIMFRIMLPMAKPLIMAISLMIFIATWNDYSTPLIYLPNHLTLGAGLYRYKIIAAYTLNTPVYFAGIFLSALPAAVLFITFNKTLMENLTIGGLKG